MPPIAIATSNRCGVIGRYVLAALLALSPWACLAQQSTGKCTPTYQNHNMIDYGPLVFRSLSGRAVDPNSVPMAAGSVGLFAEEDHRLVATTQTDQDGSFKLAAIAPGRYRLVAEFRGFCVANVPLRIVLWPRGGLRRKLVLHMRTTAIDTCSFGSYK